MQSGDYEPDYQPKQSRRSSRHPTRSNEHSKPLPIVNDMDSPMPPEVPEQSTKKRFTRKGKKKITKVIVIQEEVNSEGVDTNPNHCTTNSASNLNNHNNVIIVSGQVPKEIIGIKFPCCAAYIILFLNLILPGVGTMMGSCFITDPVLRASFCCSGCYELFMAFLIVGWCFALCHSCMFIGAAHSGMTFEEYHRTMNKSRY